MNEQSFSIWKSRVIGFLAVCCTLALLNAVGGLLSGNKYGVIFALAQGVFIFFTGSAAWYLYKSKKVGWYLSLIVILNWFGGLLNMANARHVYTSIFSVGMIGVAIWLFRPEVRNHFEVGR